MLIVETRRAITPEETGEASCALCGTGLRAGAVYARVLTGDRHEVAEDGKACPACVEYLGGRNPERFPTILEYEEACARYPEPMLGSVEEALRRQDEGTFDEVYEESEIV